MPPRKVPDPTGPHGTAVPLRWQTNFGRLTGRTWLTQAGPPDAAWNAADRSWWPVTVAGMYLVERYQQHGARAFCTSP